MNARARSIARERLQGAGLDLVLPYLLLAPAVLIALAVLLYPLWDGVRASLFFYRYGKPLRPVGFDNYLGLWTDAQFLNSLWVTVRFVALSVAIETVLGLALTHTPVHVGVHVLDFGGGALRPLAGLPHVGTVADSSAMRLISCG